MKRVLANWSDISNRFWQGLCQEALPAEDQMMLVYPACVPETWVTNLGRRALFALSIIYNKTRTEPAGSSAIDPGSHDNETRYLRLSVLARNQGRTRRA